MREGPPPDREWPASAWPLGGALVCLGLGLVSGQISGGGDELWYWALRKPPGQPPPALFGPVWILLYLMMGVAAGRLVQWRAWHALALFCFQLLLNLAWSPVFFAAREMVLALVILIVLWVVLLLTVRETWRSAGKVAFWLLVPYLAWVSYALYLNAGIVWLNR